MSFMVINNPFRPACRPRCPKTHLVALEYLLYPGERPWGLMKRLACENGMTPESLARTIGRIREQMRREQKL